MMAKFRAVVPTAGLWSLGWAVLGALLRVVSPTELGVALAPSMVASAALGALVPGALGGFVFAGVLRASGRRRLSDFLITEFAVYGAIGGTLVPLAAVIAFSGPRSFGLVAPTLAQYLISGVVCSAATLYLARRPGEAPADSTSQTAHRPT